MLKLTPRAHQNTKRLLIDFMCRDERNKTGAVDEETTPRPYIETEKEPAGETIISGMKFAAASLIFVVLPPIGL